MRCRDPTELGSLVSSVRCGQCQEELETKVMRRFEKILQSCRRPLIVRCKGYRGIVSYSCLSTKIIAMVSQFNGYQLLTVGSTSV